MRHTSPPTVETMKVEKSTFLWEQAFLDCPFSADSGGIKVEHPDDLLGIRGVHVKAAHHPTKGWQHTGKLVKYRGAPLRWVDTAERVIKDEVIVLSTTDRETIWFGTVEQYEQMWCVD